MSSDEQIATETELSRSRAGCAYEAAGRKVAARVDFAVGG